MNERDIQKRTQESLTFEQSNLWDTVIHILDMSIKTEAEYAVSQDIKEEKRSHQSGRVDGMMAFKNLLESTRTEARRLSGRDNP